MLISAPLRTLALDSNKVEVLEEYWQEHRVGADQEEVREPENESAISNGETGNENEEDLKDTASKQPMAMTESTMLEPAGRDLPPQHPALSTLDLLDTFGPLVFPLYRTLLLRQRILLIHRPPLQQYCHFGKHSSVVVKAVRLLMSFRSIHSIHSFLRLPIDRRLSRP